MIPVHEEYLVDEHGNRKAVVLPISEWQQVLAALEDLDDVPGLRPSEGPAVGAGAV